VGIVVGCIVVAWGFCVKFANAIAMKIRMWGDGGGQMGKGKGEKVPASNHSEVIWAWVGSGLVGTIIRTGAETGTGIGIENRIGAGTGIGVGVGVGIGIGTEMN
jgi:hypothetical protein